MKVQIVSFHCVLKNKLGQVVSSSFNQDVINQIETSGGRLRGLAAGLQNLTKGEKRRVEVSADQAYGLYDPGLVIEVRRSDLNRGESLELGSEITRRSPSEDEARTFRVIRANTISVVLDGNHPLAGQDLIFDIEVVAAREAVDADFEEPYMPEANRVVH